MSFGIQTAAYIAAAVLFILSLGGLSGQESAKRAVWYGIVGMAIAPASVTIIEQTVARTGRRMKTSVTIYDASDRVWRSRLRALGPSWAATGAPSPIFWIPETISFSPGFSPVSTR